MKKSSARLSLIACLLIVCALHFLSLPSFSLSSGANVNVIFEFEEGLRLTVSDTEMLIEDLPPGTRDNSNEIDVNVSTNSQTGFTLDAVVGERLRPSTNVPNIIGGNTFFASVGIGREINALPAGTWGYSVNHGITYSGLPDYEDSYLTEPLLVTDTVSDETIPFLVGAFASEEQPRGIYYSSITFRAVVNRMVNTIDKVEYLQDVDEITHASMQYDQQYQLIDKRDGKTYFVTKYRDNNIWMSQNLDFDVYDGVTLDPETSDVKAEKVLSVTDSRYSVPSNIYSRHIITQYDVGDYYCPGGICNNKDDLMSIDGLALDSEERHYSIGNLYSFLAATAESYPQCPSAAGEERDECMLAYVQSNAEESICPKGWQLPSSYIVNSGMPATNLATGIGASPKTGTAVYAARPMTGKPSYFTSSGYGYSGYENQGAVPNKMSYYWTSTLQNQDTAYQYEVNLNDGYLGIYPSQMPLTTLKAVRCALRIPTYTVRWHLNNDETGIDKVSTSVTKTWAGKIEMVGGTPSRFGYKFKGWASSPNALEPAFRPTERIVITQRTVDFYGIWERDESITPETANMTFEEALRSLGKTKEDGYYNIQDIDLEVCRLVKVNETLSVRDSRDGKIYGIKKFKIINEWPEYEGGSCWMLDNLRLGSKTENITLTPADSDVSENFELTASEQWDTTSNYRIYNDDRTDSNGRPYGYLYSYNLATVGDFERIITENEETGDKIVSSSICPKNWTLPDASLSNQYIDAVKTIYLGVEPTSVRNYSYSSSDEKYPRIIEAMQINFPGIYESYGIANVNYATNEFTRKFYKNSNSFAYEGNYPYVQHYDRNSLYMTGPGGDPHRGGAVRCMISHHLYYVYAGISYYGNGGLVNGSDSYSDGASSFRSEQDGTMEMAIEALNVKRAGYRFLGWANNKDATEPDYLTGDTLQLNQGISLYAVWEKIESNPTTFNDAFSAAGKEKHKGYYAMQDMTTEICDAVSFLQNGRLIDKRDNKVYWVVRLMSESEEYDGVCWMTQNLDFDIPVGGIIVTPETTDVESTKSLYGSEYDTGYNGVVDAGDYYLPLGGLGYSGGISTNLRLTDELETDDINWHFSLGHYYSWELAAAIKNPNSNNTQATTYGSLESICPKGWTLPYSYYDWAGDFSEVTDDSKSFDTLFDNLRTINSDANNKLFMEPFYPVAGGYLTGTAPSADNTLSKLSSRSSNFGTYAYYHTKDPYRSNMPKFDYVYWRSISNPSTENYRYMYSSSNSVITNRYDNNTYANIRCVAR